MEAHRVSVRGLAALCGLSPSMVSRLINKQRKFKLRHKTNIAKIFNTKIENIIWP
jgi:transcriptional regulator with XRE-family HTH domain